MQFYKGYFPETGEPVKDKRFSFVHLDVDLHESTLQALQFFYPRMTPGRHHCLGHDYAGVSGVQERIRRFLRAKTGSR